MPDNSFIFQMVIDNETYTLTIVMGESGYGVLIDNELYAEIATDENNKWVSVNGGTFSDEELESIGNKIEAYFI